MSQELQFCLWCFPVAWLLLFRQDKKDTTMGVDFIGSGIAAAIFCGVLFCLIMAITVAWRR